MSLLFRANHVKSGQGLRLEAARYLSGFNWPREGEETDRNQISQAKIQSSFTRDIPRSNLLRIKTMFYSCPLYYQSIRWSRKILVDGLVLNRSLHTNTITEYSTRPAVLLYSVPTFPLNFFRIRHGQIYNHSRFLSTSHRPFSSQGGPSTENPSKAQSLSETKSQNKVTDKSFISKIGDAVIGAGKSTVSFIVKIPGVLWFYITHSKERSDKWIEIKEAAKKEAHHYWMGTKVITTHRYIMLPI